MSPAPVPAAPRPAGTSETSDSDLAVDYARAARAVDAGERRSWDLAEDSDGSATPEVATWLRQVLTVPWCLETASVDAVLEQFDLMLAGEVRPGRVEVLCHVVRDHRRPTVYLAVRAWHDGALQPPRLARVEATVGSGA
jgi:hypothetical protein